jgi:hypothetical protein
LLLQGGQGAERIQKSSFYSQLKEGETKLSSRRSGGAHDSTSQITDKTKNIGKESEMKLHSYQESGVHHVKSSTNPSTIDTTEYKDTSGYIHKKKDDQSTSPNKMSSERKLVGGGGSFS